MEKKEVFKIILTAAGAGLAAVLTLSGCGGTSSSSSEAVAESSSAESAEEVSGSEVSSSSEVNYPVSDQDLAIEKCYRLGTYKGLELTRTVYEITDEDVQEYAESQAEATEVTDPGASVRDGDTVNISYEGEIDGKSFDGGTATGVDLVIGSGSYIDGFEDGLIGMKAGETKDLNLKFPDDYGVDELNGKDVVFHVTVNKISRAQGITEETLANARTEMESQSETVTEDSLYQEAWDAVSNNSTLITLRQSDVEECEDAVRQSTEEQIKESGETLEEYLSEIGMTQDEFDENVQNYAKELARENLQVEALEKAEGMSTEDPEFQEEEKKMADTYGLSEEELKEQVPEVIIRQYVETKRLSERIVSYAKITEKKADYSEIADSLS